MPSRSHLAVQTSVQEEFDFGVHLQYSILPESWMVLFEALMEVELQTALAEASIAAPPVAATVAVAGVVGAGVAVSPAVVEGAIAASSLLSCKVRVLMRVFVMLESLMVRKASG